MAYSSDNHSGTNIGWDENMNGISSMELNRENMDMFNNVNRIMYDNSHLRTTANDGQDIHTLEGILTPDNSNFQFGNLVFSSHSISNSSSPSTIKSALNNTHSDQSKRSPDTSSSIAAHEQEKHQSYKPKTKRQLLDEQDAILIAKDDSELTEEELQLKRKAQNRAAQRAFRERKETKLKELEAKLLKSEEERQKLMEELELIKKQNITISTENEILKSKNEFSVRNSENSEARNNGFIFPKDQNQFIKGLIDDTQHQIDSSLVNTVYETPDSPGKKILAIGAVWDYLQIKAEERNLDSQSFDVIEIMNKLKGNERCHGFGPAYPLELVDEIIESSMHKN